MSYEMFGSGYSAFSVLFGIVFVIILGTFVVAIVRGVSQWLYNNGQPVLERECRVVTKRATTSSHHHNHSGHMHTRYSTAHYATFEFFDGSREEFCITGEEFGMLVEGDVGTLKSQGTRYYHFLRR